MKTLKQLPVGTILIYNDMSNVDLMLEIVDEPTDDPSWINLKHVKSGSVEPMWAETEIDGDRFAVVE